MRRLTVAFAMMACAFLPATAGAQTLHATPSMFGQTWTAARGGDTILLGAGSYGSWSPTTKGTMVTLKPEDGAAVSMAAQFVGSSYLTVQGVRFSSPVVMRDNTNHVVLDGDVFDNLGQATWEGRLSLNLGAHDNTVSNSHFGGNTRCSDGVFVGDASGNTIGPGNEFAGIKQGSCGPHTDSIQLYDGPKTTIVGNYFHDSDTVIMAPDGGDHSVITDNVMVVSGYEPAVQLGSHVGTVFAHNTVIGINVHMDSKTGAFPSRDGILRDNVMVRKGTGADFNTTNGNGCVGCVTSFNLFAAAGDSSGSNALVGTPVFAGGSSPTSYAGYALAAGSPGKTNASDGSDRGIRVQGAPPPPADRDGDSIPDAQDACPDTPGVAPDGCPVLPPPPTCDQACVDAYKAQIGSLTDQVVVEKARAVAAEALAAARLDKLQRIRVILDE